MAATMRAPTFPLYDRILDGRLTELLVGWRANGLSIQQIRDRLRDDHNVDVSPQTVRRWLDDIETAPEEAVS